MKSVLFILLFLFSFLNFTHTKSNLVNWDEKKPLKWKYFNGNVPKTTRNQVALTTYTISYTVLSKNSIQINNCFVKDKSWVKKGYNQPEILRHEQYHFNLAEVYTREMRRVMQNIDKLDVNNVRSVYDYWFYQLEEAQKQYDIETIYSNNKTEQVRWENRIDSLLLNLSDFKGQIVYTIE